MNLLEVLCLIFGVEPECFLLDGLGDTSDDVFVAGRVGVVLVNLLENPNFG